MLCAAIVSRNLQDRFADISGALTEPYDKAPRGYLVLTPTRAVFFYTGGNRKFGTSVEDKAALFDTIGAWSGTYRADGNKVVFSVDVSWTENWNGTNVALNWQLSGNRLTLTRDRQPYARDPSKMVEIRQVWEKIE